MSALVKQKLDRCDFKLGLSYPFNKEFLDEDDFKLKILEFNQKVLNSSEISLNFTINLVRTQVDRRYRADASFLIVFEGRMSGNYLDVNTLEIVETLKILLEGFFVCIHITEFETIYFSIDGKSVIDEGTLLKADGSNWKSYCPDDLNTALIAAEDIVINIPWWWLFIDWEGAFSAFCEVAGELPEMLLSVFDF